LSFSELLLGLMLLSFVYFIAYL